MFSNAHYKLFFDITLLCSIEISILKSKTYYFMKISPLVVVALASIAQAKNVFTPQDFAAAVAHEKNGKREDLVDPSVFFKNKRSQSVMEAPLLQNLLPQMPAVSILAGYLRDDKELTSMIESTDSFALLIAPSDDAVSSKLKGMKPWEFPKAIKDDDTDEANIAYNIDHFLKAHLAILTGVLMSDNEITTTLLNGDEVTIRQDPATSVFNLKFKGKWYRVTSVHLADNGTVFVIDDVLSKP